MGNFEHEETLFLQIGLKGYLKSLNAKEIVTEILFTYSQEPRVISLNQMVAPN